MKKKVLSWLLILCLVITLMPLIGVKVEAATTPSGVSEAVVNERINQLKNALNEEFFTTDGRTATQNTSSKTEVWSVLKNNDTVRSLNKKYKDDYLPSVVSNLPTHYQGSYTITRGEQCAGFANYAMWYIFANKYTDKVTSKLVAKNVAFNYSNMKAILKPGDVIGGQAAHCNWDYPAPHSSVVIAVKKDGVQVIDSNLRKFPTNDVSGCNRVRVQTLYYSAYDYISVARAKNYSESWVTSLTIKNITSGKPYLTWSKRTSATKYKVYRKLASDTSYKYLATTKNRYYTDNTASPSYRYNYYVKAINSSNKTLQSTYAVEGVCKLAQPKLTGISNVDSHGGIKVSYKGVKNANRYKLYRATSASGTYEYLFDVDCKMDKGGESHYFIDLGGTPGKTYYYKVQAINTNNIGANSALSKYMARTRDLARPIVSVSTQSDGIIVLSWNKVEHADKYAVYRAVKGGNYSKIATITGTSVVNTKNLKKGTTYYYKVKALDNSSSAATSAYSEAVSKKYENKLIGLVSESTYKSKYTNTDIYSATPYYRYKTRSMQTKTSTTPLSGWTLVSQKDDYKYGSWTTTKPTSTYETTQAYYYYAYVCNCKRLYWKSTKSDTCSSCGTKMKNLLRVYSKNDPAINFKADTDGSYFTPKVISKTSPGNFGTIYRMTYKGTSITKFTSTSKKNTSFLWPSSAYKVTLYRTKTPATVYTYEKWSDWSDWSGWTSEYKSDSETNKRDTQVKYYIIKK